MSRPRRISLKSAVGRERPCPIALLNALVCAPAESGQARRRRYFEALPELSDGLPAPILGVMVLIWQLRPNDLGRRYTLTTRQSRLDFIAWCAAHGRREYAALRQAPAFWWPLNAIAEPAPARATEHDPGRAISHLMQLLLHSRTDLDFDLSTPDGRTQLLSWYLLNGRTEHGYDDVPLQEWQILYLLADAATPGLNHFQELVYLARPDVRDAFPLPAALTGYRTWFQQFLTVETRLIDALQIIATAPTPALRAGAPAFGVNVIGYAFAQLGIGEDARMAAGALQSCGVPVTMLDFPTGDTVRQDDRSMAALVASDAPYATNMVCLSAPEHARYFVEHGAAIFDSHHTIGYWPWELAHWPDEWRHLMSLADEIWASSRHTYLALAPAAPVPVHLMPMAVAPLTASARGRASFGLPKNVFLFLFAFDLNSSARRKNPLACLQAFLHAFPAGAEGPSVGLVIKTHAPAQANADWEALKTLQRSDPRIGLIEETLSKADLLALYAACDCFVSLHRAEGFGRCIAEAMLLERCVITTAYSGNLDFCHADNALLVQHKMRALKPDDYPGGAGQQWAEPDVLDAARQMRRVAMDHALARQLGACGRRTIEQEHAPQVVGQRYAVALRRLWLRQRDAALSPISSDHGDRDAASKIQLAKDE